jgi:hypothetical protein
VEKAQATLRNGEKVILEDIEVKFRVTEISPGHKVLEGSFRAHLKGLAPGLYELLLRDGRSYRIVVKGVHSDFKKGVKALFMGEVEG